jgi:hypothetical protein
MLDSAGAGNRTPTRGTQDPCATITLHPQSGWRDLNPRPLTPQASALARLRYTLLLQVPPPGLEPGRPKSLAPKASAPTKLRQGGRSRVSLIDGGPPRNSLYSDKYTLDAHTGGSCSPGRDAAGGTRTHTPVRTLRAERSTSTNSITTAKCARWDSNPYVPKDTSPSSWHVYLIPSLAHVGEPH